MSNKKETECINFCPGAKLKGNFMQRPGKTGEGK